jgi:hypothetical protein
MTRRQWPPRGRRAAVVAGGFIHRLPGRRHPGAADTAAAVLSLFADCRTIWSIPNFFNVFSNLPFLVGGAMGLTIIWKGGGSFIDPREQLPYLVFFLGALLTSAGSAYYHLAPENVRLVWDRLPMTLGFAGLVSAAADRNERICAGAACVVATGRPGRSAR